MSPAITQAANAPALTPASKPWLWVHQIFRRFIEKVIAEDPKKDWIVFVDTNPSFGIYTEIAVSSVDRLIAPANADDSSRTAANAMFILLHGMNPPHPVYGSWTYAAQAISHGLKVPKIHLVVGNRLTQNLGAAAAFDALSGATAETLYNAYKNHPSYFASRSKPPKTKKEFQKLYSVPLRDFNTAGVVAAHLGQRMSELSDGYHSVHGQSVRINAARVKDCLDAIDDVVALL